MKENLKEAFYICDSIQSASLKHYLNILKQGSLFPSLEMIGIVGKVRQYSGSRTREVVSNNRIKLFDMASKQTLRN